MPATDATDEKEKDTSKDDNMDDVDHTNKGGIEGSKKAKNEKIVNVPLSYVPKFLFSSRMNRTKVDQHFGKFMTLVKNLEVTVPFTYLISQVPSYAKFLKDILTKKRSFGEVETVVFTEECSVVLQNKSPPKLKDPGSFSILCHLGALFVDKALYRFIKYPLGILEDAPVRVRKFYIPLDFVVLGMEEDSQIPIILGRPFLCTTCAVIDVKNGTLTLSVGDDKITFTLTSTLKSPLLENTCCKIDVIDKNFDDELPQILLNDALEAVLMLEALEGEWQAEVKKLELKPLPSNLKYVYLDDNESYPMIVSSNLDDGQIYKLLTVLRMHTKAIGYSIDDFTGISPDFCMQRFFRPTLTN
ncbi:uncharacterized protein LOC141665559 [Apium graveolens]|uniref:uncharacterized protein LOC141665559 n=1 Tax=Apium graveolens TaxID=4045 RepID=UPI003D7A6AA9